MAHVNGAGLVIVHDHGRKVNLSLPIVNGAGFMAGGQVRASLGGDEGLLTDQRSSFAFGGEIHYFD